jgi:hypothetical protein
VLPWRRLASHGTAVVLLTLGVLLLGAPHSLPGFTTPQDAPMHQMGTMDS